jgi:hypothetical protein
MLCSPSDQALHLGLLMVGGWTNWMGMLTCHKLSSSTGSPVEADTTLHPCSCVNSELLACMRCTRRLDTASMRLLPLCCACSRVLAAGKPANIFVCSQLLWRETQTTHNGYP